jgi:hypothetical protein
MSRRSPQPGPAGGGPWPSAEEQVREAGAPKGSVLEKLIQEHQDRSLLHPEESPDDSLRLPLWIRVYWRRNHPDLQVSTVNPLAAYPDMLNQLHAWMLSHPNTPLGSEEGR